MVEYTLGIDIGTSSVKAGILDLSTFKLHFLASREYDSSAEQESGVIWNQTLKTLKETVGQLKETDSIRAIGLSGQMHGTVLYDSKGDIIDPIINWQDKRCDTLLKKYGGANTINRIEKILGLEGFEDLGIDKMASGFLGASLFYIKENNKTLFSKIKHTLLPTDFVRLKLIGTEDYSTDQTNAFSTGLFNTKLKKWHEKFIKKLELPLKILPKVNNTSDIAGHTSEKITKLLQFKKRVPVIYGGGDNQMSILGSGLYLDDSPVLINIGTGAQISKIISSYNKIEGIDTRSFFNDMFAYVGASLGGGNSYKWLREEIGLKMNKILSFKDLDKMAININPGCNGLRFSTGPTRQDPQRSSGFFGNKDLINSIGHMARAVMEGVLSDLYKFHRLMGDTSDNVIIGSGNGLVKRSVWSQIAADMFGFKLKITDFENAVFGAALMAAKGIGKINNFKNAFKSIAYHNILPDYKNSKKYKRLIKEDYFEIQNV